MSLLELFFKKGLLNPEAYEKAAVSLKAGGRSLAAFLVEEELVEEADLLEALAEYFGLKVVALEEMELDPKLQPLLPYNFARENFLIPIEERERWILLAVADPTNQSVLDDVKFRTGKRVEVALAGRSDILDALDKLYFADAGEVASDMEQLSPDTQVEVVRRERDQHKDVVELLQTAELPPIVRMSNAIIADAVRMGASDIHIEAQEENVKIRYRVDGVMRPMMNLPLSVHQALVSRVKVVSGMDISIKRKPQDGQVRVRVGERSFDIRVSTIPTHHGEKVVMRLLTTEVTSLTFDGLGMPLDALDTFQKAVESPQGMVLVTGPTGSGKTTTLYTTLNFLNTGEKNIITVEDPIEYQLPGINQVQVNIKAGLTFAGGLRSILRQDPNVILVGEIRDPETADIAVQAAQTGHVVLSTLHTNDSISTITRLMDIGVEPYLISSSLHCVLGQRLCRKLCQSCMEEESPSPAMLAMIGHYLPDETPPTFYKAKGCPECGNIGYRDRTGIYEVLGLTVEIKRLVRDSAPEDEILMEARKQGMRMMIEDGLEKAARGITSLEEIVANVPLPPLPKMGDWHEPAPPAREPRKVEKPAPEPVEAPRDILAAADVFEDEDIKPPKILVVDDQPANVLLIKKMLESQAYMVTEAYDGQEALEKAFEDPPDIVLTDLIMPRMDGFGLLKRLKGSPEMAGIPVILLTADTDETSELKGLELGADDYISKPVKKKILLARIKRILAQIA